MSDFSDQHGDRLLKTNKYMNTLKWALYARKSTESEERQIQSIDDQLTYLRDIANRDGLKIIETITESKSAKDPEKRDGFKKLLSLVNTGRVDGILVWKIDRLSRNPIDSATIQYYLQKHKIKCIKTSDRDYLPDDNALVYAVEQGMANQFVRDLSNNVKRGMRSKAEQGWFPNIPPIGYLNSKTREKGKETILVDTDRFDIVRKMWDLMLTGNYTLPKVLKIATDEWGLRTPQRKKLGGRPVCQRHMWKIFTNIFYTGKFGFSGQVYQGKHTPMITMDEFDRVQYILGTKTKPRGSTHEFPYTGIMTCGYCGATITASEKTKHLKMGETRKYVYYHCTKRKQDIVCNEPRLTKEEFENEILRILSEHTIHPKFTELAFSIINEMHEKEATDQDTIIQAHTNNLNEVKRKLNNLTSFLLSETISEDEYKNQKIKLLEEKSKHEKLLENLDTRSENWRNLTEDVFNFATHASEALVTGDMQTKRSIVSSLGLNYTVSGKKVFISMHSWLTKIKKEHDKIINEFGALELEKSVINYTQKEVLPSLYTRMCAGLDLNQRSPEATDLQSVVIDHSTTDA